jgi:hypothetical protein
MFLGNHKVFDARNVIHFVPNLQLSSTHRKAHQCGFAQVAAMPECSIGLFPDIGAMHWLSKMPSNFGVMLALTGASPTAVQCCTQKYSGANVARMRTRDILFSK